MDIPEKTPSKRRWWMTLSIGVILALLVSACQLPFWPFQKRTSQDTDVVPTESVITSTPEPNPDLPPALVEVDPLPGSVIALTAPLTFYFNQPMDTDSVEASIRFEPSISGNFSWEAEQILTFTPDEAIFAGSDLSVTLTTGVQAANKKSLMTPVTLEYQTAQNLVVTQTIPSDDAQEVDPESAIVVVFNQPVVTLGFGDRPPAFTLSPTVDGEGEWLNTSTYVFTPQPSLDGGVTYTIQLNESLTSNAGTGLNGAQPREFEFTTTLPAVIQVLPPSEKFLGLEGPVEVRFNIRMDPESVADNFALKGPDGELIRGEFEWDDDLRKLSFTPNEKLAYGTTYTVRIDSGAESFGGIPIDSPLELTRSTYPTFTTDPIISPEFTTYYGEFGSYKIFFTAPVDKTNYKQFISIEPEISNSSIYLSDNNTSLNVSGYFKPETQYTLSVAGDFQDVWGGQLGQPVTYTFSTPSAKSSFTVASGASGNNLIFVPAEESEFVLQATNINTMTLALAPISTDDLIMLLHPDNYDYRQVYQPDHVEITTHNLDLPRNVSEVITFPLTYQGNPLDTGVYFLQVSSPDLPEDSYDNYLKYFLIVSENNVVMKASPDQILVWVTKLADFFPLNDVAVSFYTTEGELLVEGRTDADGMFNSDFQRFDKSYKTFFVLVGEPGQDSFSFSISTWGQGYTLYELGINLDTLPSQTGAYIYIDRPIYRPGDTVNYKALVFDWANGQPQSTSLDQVTISVFGDPGMTGIPANLYTETLNLSLFGTVSDSLVLPENAPPGSYRIEVKSGEVWIDSLYFEVATYRKPDIEMSVTLDPSAVLWGDSLTAEIQADYYFGMPAADQPFSWTLYRDDLNFHLPGYWVGPLNTDWLTPRMSDKTPLGVFVSSAEGRTDQAGHISLDFSPADLALDRIQQGVMQEFNLEVILIDESGFPVTYRDSSIVHPEEFYIGVKPGAYFGTAEMPFNFSILTVDWDREIVGDIPIEASFETIEWEVESTTDPTQPYRYTTITELVSTASPTTGSDGRALLEFTPPEPGTYRLTVSSGGAITQVLVWVSGASSAAWPLQPQNQIKLTPDADAYQPGETAEVFIPNPFNDGAKALVTIERGEIMNTQILDLTSAGHTLQIPLTEESLPNIYVSVMLLGKNGDGNPDYRYGIVNLPVTPNTKILDVEIFIEPQETTPGESVSATLKITDEQGNPVQGEFSIAVVDKAVLALLDPNSPPIAEALYGEKPLSVQTNFSLLTYATQLALISMDLGRGGGGGDMLQATTIREDFPDTAFWRAEIITGSDGTAALEIPMPDTLTTWIVDVRGLSEDYLVGQAEAEILTSKDLMVRPVTPRFLVDGDQVQMAAIVYNNTNEVRLVDLTLQSTGFMLAPSVQKTQQVEVEPGSSKEVTWWGTVQSVKTVALVFQAVSGDLSDASIPQWGDLPVIRYTVPYTFSTTGQLSEAGQRLEVISLPMTIDPTAGDLTLELTTSLTSILIDGLEALEDSRYGDTVSLISRLLANLNAYLALNRLGIESPQLEANLEDLANKGLHELLEAQNPDGGWSWWPEVRSYSANSDPFITGYALLGLEQATQAGLEVSDHFTDLATEYLSSSIIQTDQVKNGWEWDRQAFLAYTLRNEPQTLNDSYLNSLFENRAELSPWSLGLLTLTIHVRDGMNNQVRTLLSDLETRAVRTATGVHWENDRHAWMLPGTPVFNTAVGVLTLAKLDPASQTLSPAVHYLLKYRNSDNLWSSTFESGWSLMAITEALAGTGDYQADYTYQATLNEALIAAGSAGGSSAATPVAIEVPIGDLYPANPNALSIERGEGSGTLYYRAELEAFQPAETAPAVNRGVSLSREYYLMQEGCPGLEDCLPITDLTLDPSDPSQLINVTLTLVTSQDIYHLMLEDFIPAGTEIFNQNFKTSQSLSSDMLMEFNPRRPFVNGWGWWYFNEPQLYDDHILWTADFLPAGTYTLTYLILPYQRGVYQVLPAHAWQYFYPEVQGTSSGSVFTID